VFEKYFRNGLRFTTSAYYFKVKNIITSVTDPNDDTSMFMNTGDVTGKGIELEAEKTWAGDITLRLSQTFQYAKDDSTGRRAANSPASLSTLNLSLPLVGSKLYGGFEAQYVSGRHAPEGGCVPSYWLANLTLLAKDVVKNLDLTGSVYNLFDQTVKYPTSNEFLQKELVGDGINFRIKACYRF
jgi:iron complex outermembrane receptor protein